jgi:hypothetical protein
MYSNSRNKLISESVSGPSSKTPHLRFVRGKTVEVGPITMTSRAGIQCAIHPNITGRRRAHATYRILRPHKVTRYSEGKYEKAVQKLL